MSQGVALLSTVAKAVGANSIGRSVVRLLQTCRLAGPHVVRGTRHRRNVQEQSCIVLPSGLHAGIPTGAGPQTRIQR